MEISSVPLAEFYRDYLENVRKREFKWIVTLLARDADAEEIYDNLRKKWRSLNSITGQDFLFVLAGNENESSGSHAMPGPHVNKSSDTLSDRPYRPYDWKTDKEGYLNRIQENQTDAINSLKKLFGLKESEIPCLVIVSLLTGKQHIVPIDVNADDLYGYFRSLICKIEPLLQVLRSLEDRLHHIAAEMEHTTRSLLFLGGKRMLEDAEQIMDQRTSILNTMDRIIEASIVQKKNTISPVSCAHPLGRPEYLHIIANYLAQIIARLDLVNPNNLMDFNHSLEQTYCGLLNRIFGWQLHNLNRVNMNIPGIDLACETGKICVQISSDASPDKIRRTLTAFFDREYDKKYEKLYIVFLRKYTSGVKDFDNCLVRPFSFTYNEHIFDTARLYNQIFSIEDTNKLAEIADYLRDELGKFPC